MTNAYCSFLMAILMASSACLAVESTQSQPSVAIITGEVQNPRSREIVLYEPLLLSHQRIILDSQNRFTLALPVGHGTLVIGGDEGEQQWVKLLRAFIFGYNPLIFFVEPGDSLHVVIEKGFFNSSYAFSGPNADNSRFMAEWSVPFDSFDLDFEDLQVENFSRQMDQWRREQFEFLAEGREQYALSLGCIDYVTASVNYDWVNRMIAYPRAYSLVNGHENKNIPPEFYDFLAEMPLVDEKAVGVGRYRIFLMNSLQKLREESAAFRQTKLSERYDLSSLELSEETVARLDSVYEHRQSLGSAERIDLSGLGLSEAVQAQFDAILTDPRARKRWSFAEKYDFTKQQLEGRVLYWFLSENLISAFKHGSSETLAAAQRKWEDFQASNPYPEYTEAVQTALDKALKLQFGQPAPEFTLQDLDGQPVSLSQFKGQVVLLDFWASWCGPCIENLPDLRKIKERTEGQPVVFLNLSLDDNEAAWRKAVDKHEIKGVHVRAAGLGSDVARSYNIDALPSYYLVDSQGLIVERLRILRNTDEIVATIEKSL